LIVRPNGFLLGVLLAAVIAGAAWWVLQKAADEPRPAPAARVLRRGNGAEPETLDPQSARSESALTILRDLYEGLTEVGADGRPKLTGAVRVEISADAKTYTFHLRSNSRWSNGDPVVAEDYVAAWRRLVDPQTAAPYAQILAPIANATGIAAKRQPAMDLGVSAIDPSTIKVQLESPTPYFLSLLTHPATFPIHRTTLQRADRKFSHPGMVSNGAYTLARWDFGTKVVLARNRRYWNDSATQIDRLEYYVLPDPEDELRVFRAGELDSTSTIPAAQFAWIKSHLGAQLRISPQLALYYYGFDLRRAPLAAQPKLRLALSMVIDRERLVQAITGAGELPAYTLAPPGTDGYSPPIPAYAHWPMARRVERARELLREAGLGLKPISLELAYNRGELHDRIAVAVASMWKQHLQVTTRLRAEEFKALLQDIDRGDTQIFRASWVADYNDAFTFLQLASSRFGINLSRYSNPKYDALLREANSQTDGARRFGLLQQAEATMLAEQPLIPLYFYVSKHLVNPRVRGWQDNVMNVIYSKDLSLDTPAK
jgi:oligopeptide transport system substrate-binding protein